MQSYAGLFRRRGVAKIVVVQFFARFPIVIFPIALLLFVQKIDNSFFSAGIVLSAFSLSQAVFSPVIARLTTVWPPDNVLIVCAFIFSGIVIPVSIWQVPFWLMAALFAVCGAVMPPTQSVIKALYGHLVSPRFRSALFSVDAILQELIWIIGPIVVTSVAMAFSPAAGMILMGLGLLLSSIWLSLCREIKNLKIPRAKNVFGRVLRKPAVSSVVLIFVLFMGACTAIELTVVAAFREVEKGGSHSASLAGVVIAVWSLGSMIGGFVVGHRPIGRWSIPLRIIPFLAGIALVSFSEHPVWMSAALFICGLGLAPVVSASYSYVSSATTASEAPEAFGWMASGQLLGTAAFSTIAGWVVDGYGIVWGFALSGVGAVATVVLAIAIGKLLPTLHHDPPTAPVDLIL